MIFYTPCATDWLPVDRWLERAVNNCPYLEEIWRKRSLPYPLPQPIPTTGNGSPSLELRAESYTHLLRCIEIMALDNRFE